jgi:hypothetical protein
MVEGSGDGGGARALLQASGGQCLPLSEWVYLELMLADADGCGSGITVGSWP